MKEYSLISEGLILDTQNNKDYDYDELFPCINKQTLHSLVTLYR
jgi:hypothetical protein